MQQQEIHNFLEQYFRSNHCEILDNHEGYLIIQLTIELDKALMNRPFYWHYLEKTGGVPNPMKLTFITNPEKAPENIKGEIIHFGSPRLHQIFQSTKKIAGYIRLYEHNNYPQLNNSIPLLPWLCLNVKISYQCDRKKDVFYSIGLNLISGHMMENFHNHLLLKNLTPKIPDYSFTLSPLIKPKSGISRIENYLKMRLLTEDHSWAEHARLRWEQDLELLNHFYKDQEEKPDSYNIEKLALSKQYQPQIKISIINGGLFYLAKEAI